MAFADEPMIASNTTTDPALAADPDADMALLRRFEPIVRFTQGEQFFPADVRPYIEQCSLWAHYPDGAEEMLAPEGRLTLAALVEPRPSAFGTVHFLRLVPVLTLTESAQAIADRRALERRTHSVFHAGQGRLARGGLLPRLLDALFMATLLLRGRVPGATAAAAELEYHRQLQADEKYVYYGRVLRQGGWTILQYWLFYYYNSWRSGFQGVNDHEADWEVVMVYLYEDEGRLKPEWAGYASHDFHGDDLRRHWDDDKELEVVNGHPVVYAGAGSHAAYFRRGEYQAEVSLPLPKWSDRGLKLWQKFWTETLGQTGSRERNPFRIPFVDYARGDGLSIGPTQSKQWSPVLIDESTPWVSQYRGLWGLFARDPISGENAPAGPMYNRDGSPRGSWYDPLGFAGLDRIAPPPQELQLLAERCERLQARQAELESLLPTKTAELQSLGAELKGMEGNPHLARQYDSLTRKLAEAAAQTHDLRREQSQNIALLDGLSERLERLQAGVRDDPRGHIRRLATPVSSATARFNRFVEAWAAVSISLLLLAVLAVSYLAPDYLWLGVLLLLLTFTIVESLLRGTFTAAVTGISVALALIASLILVFHFWRVILLAGLAAAAVLLLVQKLRELRD